MTGVQRETETIFGGQRSAIADTTLERGLIERIVKSHLDLYLPANPDVITIDHDTPTEAQSLASIPFESSTTPSDTIPSRNGYGLAIDTHDNPNTTII